jgi:hypothetical protein
VPVWRRTSDVPEFREIGGEVVLVHDGRLLAGNAVATTVWDLLDEPRPEVELVAFLEQTWPETPVGRDVRQFLRQLAERGLIEEV